MKINQFTSEMTRLAPRLNSKFMDLFAQSVKSQTWLRALHNCFPNVSCNLLVLTVFQFLRAAGIFNPPRVFDTPTKTHQKIKQSNCIDSICKGSCSHWFVRLCIPDFAELLSFFKCNIPWLVVSIHPKTGKLASTQGMFEAISLQMLCPLFSSPVGLSNRK